MTNTWVAWVEVRPVGDCDWKHVGTAPAWAISLLIMAPSECSAIQARVKMHNCNGFGGYSCASQPLILIPSTVNVVVYRLSGKRVDFEVHADSDVSALKRRMALLWAVPPICQQLTVGTEILHDDETWAMVHMQQVARILQEYFSTDVPNKILQVAAIDVTLVADHRTLYAILVNSLSSRSFASTRTWARKSLLDWARKDDQACSMCIMLLQARDHHVRRTAILTLGQIATPGGESTVNALLECDRRHWSVRAALLEVLPIVAGTGNEHVGAMLIEGLLDVSPWVRQEACESLTKYTSEGDAFAMTALVAALDRIRIVPDKRLVSSVCRHLLPKDTSLVQKNCDGESDLDTRTLLSYVE